MTVASISETERAQVRAAVFNHLAGIVLAPTVKALAERGILDGFRNPDSWLDLDVIQERTSANRGYLRVAMRLLAAAGWLKQRVEDNGRRPLFAVTPEGRIAFEIAPPLYAEVVSF